MIKLKGGVIILSSAYAADWNTKQMTDSWKIFYDGFGEYERDRVVIMMFPFWAVMLKSFYWCWRLPSNKVRDALILSGGFLWIEKFSLWFTSIAVQMGWFTSLHQVRQKHTFRWALSCCCCAGDTSSTSGQERDEAGGKDEWWAKMDRSAPNGSMQLVFHFSD